MITLNSINQLLFVIEANYVNGVLEERNFYTLRLLTSGLKESK